MKAFLTRDGSGAGAGEAFDGKSRGGVWKDSVRQKDGQGTATREIIPETEVLP